MKLTRMPDGSFQLAQAETPPAAPADSRPADPHVLADPHAADATHAGTAADGGHGGGFPPFSPENFVTQLFWLAITFGLLYYVMSRYALPRIAGILEERRTRIEGDLAEAHRMKAESDAAVAAYEQALTDARARAQKTAAEAREAAARESEASRKALEDALSQRISDAEARIAATKTTALGSVHGIAADAAGAIVQQLVGTAPPPAEVESAVRAALSRRTA
jgi:F-type H+-transporting ATPase subunit b